MSLTNETSTLNESSSLNENTQIKDEIKLEQQSNKDEKLDSQSNQLDKQLDKSLNRIIINDDSFDKLTKDELIKKWKEQNQFIDYLEAKLKLELTNKELYRDNEDKIKQQLFDLTRKENLLLMKLTTKEHEMQEYIKQNQELKLSQIASNDQLQNTFLDPAINMIFEEMKKEVEKCKSKVEEMQNELSAWKFTPDSNTGKRLMAKCRLLYQENEELGVAKLESDLALQKSLSEELKKGQDELDEFLVEIEEDVEGMQSTIYHLQQQLKEEKDKVKKLKEENQLKENLREKQNDLKSTEEQSINNEQNNKIDDKKDELVVKMEDNLELSNNEPIKNGNQDDDKNNLERKRSLDEVLEEVNQSGNECGIDSIIRKHRKLESGGNSISN